MKTQCLLIAISISILDVAAYGCGGDDTTTAKTGDAVAAGSGSEGTALKPQAATMSASDQLARRQVRSGAATQSTSPAPSMVPSRPVQALKRQPFGRISRDPILKTPQSRRLCRAT